MLDLCSRRLPLLAMLVLLSCAGCSGLVSVQGQVTLDDQPLPDAVVMFVPTKGGRPVTGKSDAAGRFQLTTNNAGDGVAPGQYVVTVTANQVDYQLKPGEEQGYVEKVVWRAPEKYSKAATSGLTQAVTSKTTHVKIELKSPP